MHNQIVLPETYNYKQCVGELEFEFKDRNGQVISRHIERNLVKVQAKEIIAHCIVPRNVWDEDSGTGAGAWISTGIDSLDDYFPKYIVFGASFDRDTHAQVDAADSDFYVLDSITGGYIPKALGIGAEFDGGLINAIPISEPYRPLKRVERVYFEPSYQPAGTPLLQDDIRAMNNVVVFETTLTKEEYNGFNRSSSDYFTVTEVVLAGGVELDMVGACELDPHDLFLRGRNNREPLLARATGTSTITLDASESAYVNLIKEGDQIKIVAETGTGTGDTEPLQQLNPYYLVVNKVVGGSDVVLDRTPVQSDNTALSGDIGVYRDSFRIFSHVILKAPFKKNETFSVLCRWRIAFN